MEPRPKDVRIYEGWRRIVKMRVSEEKKIFFLSLSFLAWSDCIGPLCRSKLGRCIVFGDRNLFAKYNV